MRISAQRDLITSGLVAEEPLKVGMKGAAPSSENVSAQSVVPLLRKSGGLRRRRFPRWRSLQPLQLLLGLLPCLGISLGGVRGARIAVEQQNILAQLGWNLIKVV